MAVLVGQQGAVWTRIARNRDDIVGQQGAVWTRIARNRDDIVRQQGAVWTRIARNRDGCPCGATGSGMDKDSKGQR